MYCVTVQCAVMCHGKVAVSLLCVNYFLLLTALTDPSYIYHCSIYSTKSCFTAHPKQSCHFLLLRITTHYCLLYTSMCNWFLYTFLCNCSLQNSRYNCSLFTIKYCIIARILHKFVHMQFLHSIICFLNIYVQYLYNTQNN